MATLRLQTSVTLKSDGTSFFFGDITPLFNPISNPFGYDTSGSPTGFPASSVDTTKLYLDVTTPDGTVTSITIPGADFIIANIGVTGAITYEVTAAALGLTTIKDGVYHFKYTITDVTNGRLYTSQCDVVSDHNVCCCLDKKLKDIQICATCTKEQKSKKIDDLYNAYMLRHKAKYAAACGDLAGAQKILNDLLNYCNIKRCDAC